MMQVIADYTFKMFLTFYILQAGPPKSCRVRVNFPLLLSLSTSLGALTTR